jgi:hypothetical protein
MATLSSQLCHTAYCYTLLMWGRVILGAVIVTLDNSVASGHLGFASGPADFSAKMAGRLQRILAGADYDAKLTANL